MTDDDIKYHAMEHLLAQGEMSLSINGCAYRGADGNRCAVGFFIEDSEYSEEMEGSRPAALLDRGLLPERLVKHVELLTQLQFVHDDGSRAYFAENFENSFGEPYPTFRARYLANKQETVDA